MKKPFSILITSYNYSQYLGECIQSCIDQNFNSGLYEIILIDDASRDKTSELLQTLDKSRLLIKALSYNHGIEKAANIGFKMSTGDFIVRLDADDVLHPNYLKIMSAHLNNQFHFFYPNYYLIDSQSSFVSTTYLPCFDESEIISRGDFLATGTLLSRKMIEKLGYYDETIKNSGLENYDLILRAIKAGYIGCHVNEHLFSYRRHAGNISTLKKSSIIDNGNKLIMRLFGEQFKTNENHPYQLVV